MEHGNAGMEAENMKDFPQIVLREKENPSYQDLWKRFTASGKIGDYLDYLSKNKGEAGREQMF